MAFFTTDYIDFFNDLEQNNNKEWFHLNKKRYEKSVKEPFKRFTQALIDEIQQHDSRILIEPKHAMSRINRDIRFSKDKTPYNLHLNVFIAPNGKKDPDNAMFAIRLSTTMVGVMGGMYQLNKEQLSNFRSILANDGSDFRALLDAKEFSTHFPEILGEKMKRIPKELKEEVEKEPLILLKQFYFMKELPVSLINSEDLMEELMKLYLIMKPVNDCLTRMMGGRI